MTVRVSANFGRLRDLPLTTPALMRDVGLLARERIYRRTIAGVDADNRRFVAYTPGYARIKAAELGPGPVNLQVSGAMLNAMTILETTATSVTIGFAR